MMRRLADNTPGNRAPASGVATYGVRVPRTGAAVEVARTSGEAARFATEWQSLADRAADPNVFYEPWCFLPALNHYGKDRDTRIAFVHDVADGNRRLIGVFPLEYRRRFHRQPLPHMVAWQHPQLFLASPLVDPERGSDAWTLLLGWARDHGTCLIDLPGMVAGGGTVGSLHAALGSAHRRCRSIDQYDRALLCLDAPSAETYIERSSSAGSRKSWRRQFRRLSEQGNLEVRSLQRCADAGPWIDGFLALEASGWKGRAGTALAVDPAETQYFRAVCAAAADRGALHMAGLYIDGRAVALQCNLMARGGGFAFKVAFDESWAAYSPGVLLEIESIRDVFARSDFTTMDSCTGKNHPLMNRLWSGTRSIEHYLVATGGMRGRLILAVYPVVKRLRAMRKAVPSGSVRPNDAGAGA